MKRKNDIANRTSRAGSTFVVAATIEFRIRGAAYHLSIIREQIENKIIGNPWRLSSDEVDMLHWHLASFYWELVATFDCALQVLSAYHKLGLDRRDISWPKCKMELEKKGIQDQYIEKMGDVYKSEWYKEVQARRHYVTHWSDAFVQALQAKGKVVAVGTIRRPNLIDGCKSDLENMRDMVNLAMRTFPNGHISF